MEVTFIAQPVGPFVDVFFEGELVGCIQPIPTGVWVALTEPGDLPITAASGRGVERLQSKGDAAGRLISIWRLSRMTG